MIQQRTIKPVKLWVVCGSNGVPWMETVALTRKESIRLFTRSDPLDWLPDGRNWKTCYKAGFRCVKLTGTTTVKPSQRESFVSIYDEGDEEA